ncbi:MAG: heme-binding protein [Acidimicrobiia bacterium]|nr:heme-binding protein [Acidimicrobiia bacterium]
MMSRYEEPAYSVIQTGTGYEIRRYEPYLVAETTVFGDFDSTGNVAFRRLAGFIFGRNSGSVKMNMTVPVTRQAARPGAYRYRFVMEREYSEGDLPRPVDDSVQILRVPAGVFAVTQYRGNSREALFRATEADLLSALARDGVVVRRTAISAVYNGPFTPPMLRRNEVLIPIVWEDREAA